jgi:penicillin-binding protein activator
MNATRIAASMIVMTGMAAFVGCSSNQNWRVKRVDPTTTTDIDYRFNDEDARQVFQSMVADALARPWVDNWMRENGGQRPIVFLGNVRNETQDYINTGLFTTQVQEELINSGRVRVKAERDARAELRDERLDVRYNDPATIKAVAKEINADFALVGRIMDNKQRSGDGRTVVNYYQANMELINVETAEKVWIQTEEIKKIARR